LLNPFITFYATKREKKLILKIIGKFIGDFSATLSLKKMKKKIITSENLLVDTIFARFHLCPWYKSYFLRYYIDPNFYKIWNQMKKIITKAMLEAKIVTKKGKNKFQYNKKFLLEEEFHLQTIKSVARFWAIGSILHKNIPNFPDYYIQKAEKFIREKNLQNRCKEMLKFLQKFYI
jgi:hypothetical protein